MTGLLLFSHGSVVADAGEALQSHAERLRKEHGFSLVEVGYLNYSEPPFAEAASKLAAAGAKCIVVVPFFLAPGYFVSHSLPQCIQAAKSEHPEVEFIPAEPLGEDPCLADALIDSALEQAGIEVEPDATSPSPAKAGEGWPKAGVRASCALLVMVHGSPQADANNPMFQVVQEVRRRGAFPLVTVGFMECNEPSIVDAIATCAQQGARKIVAVPYFLHLGAHVTEDLPALITAATDCYPSVEFAMGEYIGKSARLTPLLAQRAREALAGNAATGG